MEESIVPIKSKFVLESIRIEKENTNENVQQQVNEMDVDTNGKVDHFELRKKMQKFSTSRKNCGQREFDNTFSYELIYF